MSERLLASILVQGVWIDVRFDNEYDEDPARVRRRFIDRAMSQATTPMHLNTLDGSDIYVSPINIGAVRP